VLCEFQYGCLALCGLAPVVVLRSFGDRVEVFTVSVSLSPSLGRIQPWSGIKLVIPAVSTASYLVLKPTVVKIGSSPYQFISVLIKHYAYFVKTKSGNVVSHNYTSSPTYTPASPTLQEHFDVVGLHNPGGGYGMGFVAEPPELFWLRCASHRYTADHFKRNNPLVYRVSARCNHGSTGLKQVYLA
jgi:hypothetical protein